jgi:hypothetical protein
MKGTEAFFSSTQGDSVVCIDQMTVLPPPGYKQTHMGCTYPGATRSRWLVSGHEKNLAASLARKRNALIIRGKLDVLWPRLPQAH